jgi:hypothetical protein
MEISVRTLFFVPVIALSWAALAFGLPARAADVGATTTSGAGPAVAGSGRVVEERRTLSAFTAVRLNGPVDLELRASDRESVTVRADDNIAPLIETRVAGGDRPALEIGVQPGASFRSSRSPLVVVEFRALSELVMRGSGDVKADRIRGDDFVLSMNGSGDARIETLETGRFAVALSGSGDLVVSGRAEQQAIRIAGSGDVNAQRLAGRDVQVAIAGSGDVTVNASETLDATISGSGDVGYVGSPRVTQRIRGSGSVHRIR